MTKPLPYGCPLCGGVVEMRKTLDGLNCARCGACGKTWGHIDRQVHNKRVEVYVSDGAYVYLLASPHGDGRELAR